MRLEVKFKSTEGNVANPSENSIEYYRDREQHELKLAENAASPAIRNIHVEMAEGYRKLVALLSRPHAMRTEPAQPTEVWPN